MVVSLLFLSLVACYALGAQASAVDLDQQLNSIAHRVGKDVMSASPGVAVSEAVKAALEKYDGEVKDLAKAALNKDAVAESLGQKIGKAVAEDGLAPRFLGAGIMGVTQIATDWVKMALSRY